MAVFRGRAGARRTALRYSAGSADAETRGFPALAARGGAAPAPNIGPLRAGEHDGPFSPLICGGIVTFQRSIEGGLRPNPRATLPMCCSYGGLGHAHYHGIGGFTVT